MGRRKGAPHPLVVLWWAVGWRGTRQGPMPTNTPSNDSTKHFYVKGCGKHLTLRTSNSVAKQASKGQPITCKGCDGGITSSGEREAWEALNQMEGILVLHNDFTLPHHNPDFTLICTTTCSTLLLVEIDGAQHVKTNMHDTPLQRQAEIDNCVDTLALQTQHRLLRVHHMDMPHFLRLLNIALQMARADPSASWVMYSVKYNRALRTL